MQSAQLFMRHFMAVLTVSELNDRAMQLVRKHADLQLLLIEGEIANLKIQNSGHLYFSLRDGECSVRAVMFRHLAENLRFQPRNGMQVIVAAGADIYPANGIFQLHVTDMLLQGLGTVQRGLQQRERKLRAEGVFDQSVKKQIPEELNKIGLVTSSKGAVLQDMLRVLERRCPLAEIIVFPAQVQGKQAETEICQALALADSKGCDVLILGRGGGSAENLDVFNSENIVRTVYRCKTPVISAIGHETDITLVDIAADLRAATPSVAAELASQTEYPEILLPDRKQVISVCQVQTGDRLKICLPDGCITVKVESEENHVMNEFVNKQLKEYAERVENYMLSAMNSMQKKTERNAMHVENLFDAMRYSLTAGGKRIRPALVYAFCHACGGDLKSADAAACAMEMTHTSSLIFDDLPSMDNDDFRRGKPSCHKAFGEATAILAGDALICMPFALLADNAELHAEQKIAVIQVLSECEGISGMVGGQMLDMQFEQQEQVKPEELEIMCLGKTGALMQASCQMGCICGGGSPEQIQAAGNYGNYVGLAFQIIDDILDVTSTSEQLGKPVGSDLEENKTTFVTLMGIEHAKVRAMELTKLAHEQLNSFADADFLHALTDALLVRVQ